MKIADLFVSRELTDDQMLTTEIAAAKRSYALAPSDAHALAFAARTLRKNMNERTRERDALHAKASVRGNLFAIYLILKLRAQNKLRAIRAA